MITTLAQETKARGEADERIRAAGVGFAIWTGTAWPPRPHYGKVWWEGPASAGSPPEARAGDMLFEVG